MKKKFASLLMAIALVISLSTPYALTCSADEPSQIVYQDLGTTAPPSTLGEYALVSKPDGYVNNQSVTSIPTALGDITLDQSFNTREIDEGWGTWSHSYTGRVYCNDVTPLTKFVMTMPSSVYAFTMYLEPNNEGPFSFSVTTSDGTVATKNISGSSGATGFGFYSTGTQTISSITITVPSAANGLAFGEISTNKALPKAPAAPVLSATTNSITAQPVDGCEYSLDNATWSDNNTFTTGITPNKQYTVYMRLKKTASDPASLTSSAQITTLKATQDAPSVPTVSVSNNSLSVQASANYEYSLDNQNWTTVNIFDNLIPGSQYTVYVRYAASITADASQSTSVTVTIPAVKNPKTDDKSLPTGPVLFAFATLSGLILLRVKKVSKMK